jgi:acylphosphatase
MKHHTRHLVIVGHVQGVGFRYAMERKAAELDIHGWVRNRRDRNVEAVIQGTPEAVAHMVAWTRHGPRNARVERVEVEPAEGVFDVFATFPRSNRRACARQPQQR